MSRASVFATIVLLGITAIPAARAQGPTAEQAAANRLRPFTEGQAALERYTAAAQCAGPDDTILKDKIAGLQKDTSLFQTAGMHDYAAQAREWHTTLAFGYADAALKFKCLDDADAIYRGLVTFYVGASYSGIRDRARIGIDDVRALR